MRDTFGVAANIEEKFEAVGTSLELLLALLRLC